MLLNKDFNTNAFICTKMCGQTRRVDAQTVVCTVSGRSIHEHAHSGQCPHPAVNQFQKFADSVAAVIGASGLAKRMPAAADEPSADSIRARIDLLTPICNACPYRQGDIRPGALAHIDAVVPCELAHSCCGGGPGVVSLAYSRCPGGKHDAVLNGQS